MKKAVILTALTLATIAMTGCSGMSGMKDVSLKDVSTPLDYKTGTYVSQEQLASFQKGKTRKADVIAVIGHPNTKSDVGGKELWTYTYTQIAALPLIGSNKFENTNLEFNRYGVLVDAYKSGGSPGQSGNPLLDAAGM